jgi:Ssp1 endopeptidase immunity protein Rap1a
VAEGMASGMSRRNTRRLLCVALVAAASLTTRPAASVPSLSVAEAVSICEAGFAPPNGQAASASRRNACLAYIDGVVGTVAQITAMAAVGQPPGPGRHGLFCIPGDEPYERLSDVFIRFARANPQHNDRAAAAIFVAAFAASYPCK